MQADLEKRAPIDVGGKAVDAIEKSRKKLLK